MFQDSPNPLVLTLGEFPSLRPLRPLGNYRPNKKLLPGLEEDLQLTLGKVKVGAEGRDPCGSQDRV